MRIRIYAYACLKELCKDTEGASNSGDLCVLRIGRQGTRLGWGLLSHFFESGEWIIHSKFKFNENLVLEYSRLSQDFPCERWYN